MVWVLGGSSSDVQRLVQLAVGWPPIVKLWYQGSGAGPLMFNEWRRCLGKVLPKTIKIASPKSAKSGTHLFIEIRKMGCAKTQIKYCLDGPPIVNPRYDLSGNTVLMVLRRPRNGMGARGMVLGCSKVDVGAWGMILGYSRNGMGARGIVL